MCLSLASPARAQDAREEPRFTLVLVGADLADALHELVDKTRLNLFFDSELVSGRRTFCNAKSLTAEAVLRCVLEGTGLDFVRLSDGTYVVSRSVREAPRYGRLRGRIVDAETGSPLANANVILSVDDVGAASNAEGRFAFARVTPGVHRVVVTHVAYETLEDTLRVGAGVDDAGSFELEMLPRVISAAPIVIDGLHQRLPSSDLGSQERTATDLAAEPGFDADPLSSLGGVVGIQTGGPLSDLHLQGGASGDHQYTLDGARVFVPIRNGGLVGPFSPYALRHITVHKAGFAAQYGSQISGVIEVEHVLAPADGSHAFVQVDPLGINARSTGRIGTNPALKATWMIGVRKGLWDVFRDPRLESRFRSWSTPNPFLLDVLDPGAESGSELASRYRSEAIDLDFSDLHVALAIDQERLRSLHVSAYHSTNIFGSAALAAAPNQFGAVADEYRWSNTAAQVRFEWVQGSRAFLRAGIWTSSYRLDHPFGVSPLGGDSTAAAGDFNEIDELGGRVGFDLAVHARHTVTASIETLVVDGDFTLAYDPLGQATAVTPSVVRPVRWRWHASVEDAIALSRATVLTIGSRYTWLHAQGRLYSEPRISVRHDIERAFGTWAFRLAAGRYRQFVDQLDVAPYSVSSLMPSFRFWLPVGKHNNPATALHLAGDVALSIGDGLQFAFEGYYKRILNQIALDFGGRLDPDPQPFVDENGYALGAGLNVAWQVGRMRAEGSYEYGRARTRVDNRFRGEFVPAPWERPHEISVRIDARAGTGWTATARWTGVWGRSWGFRKAYYDYLEPDPATRGFAGFDFSDPAAHNLTPFSQLDVGVGYTREIAGVRSSAQIQVVNALSRKNEMDWALDLNRETGFISRSIRYAAPRLPMISVQLAW